MLTKKDISVFASTRSKNKASKILQKIESEKNRAHLLISDRKYMGRISSEIEDLFKYLDMARKSNNTVAFNYFISTVTDLAKERNKEAENKEKAKKSYQSKFFIGSLFFAIAEMTEEEKEKNDLLGYAKFGIKDSPLHDVFDSIDITTDKESIELLVLAIIVPKMSRKIVYERRVGLVQNEKLSLFFLNALKERGRLSQRELEGIRNSTDHEKVYKQCNTFLKETTAEAESEEEILKSLWKEYTS